MAKLSRKSPILKKKRVLPCTSCTGKKYGRSFLFAKKKKRSRKYPNYQDYLNSPEWKKKTKLARESTHYRCTLFPFLKADLTHHLTYDNVEYEWIWRDIVPLSSYAHGLVHSLLGRKLDHSLTPFFNALLRSLYPLVVVLGWLLPKRRKR